MISRTIALATGLLFGVVTSQLPEFGQQYRQRLGGAIEELQGVVRQFDADALASGLNRTGAIQHMTSSSDPFLQRRGHSIERTVSRLDKLQNERGIYDRAGSFGRIIALAENADGPILRSAFNDFEPAVPVTSEGFVIGGAGFLTGWGFVHLLVLPFHRRKRRKGGAIRST